MKEFSSRVDEVFPSGIRLDRYIADYLKILNRSQIKAKKLSAEINAKPVKLSRNIFGGEKIDLSWQDNETLFLVPENIDLNIVYEDERVIVLDKEQGMVVHPGAGNKNGTLANALLYRRLNKKNELNSLNDISLNNNFNLRPGIVHRLDKDTSGIMIAAWDEDTHGFLGEQFKKRKVIKTYAALVHGRLKNNSGKIDNIIYRSSKDRKKFTVNNNSKGRGRRSITWYKVFKNYGDFSLILIRPKTGRTHQIRVHMKHLGNPIIGDPLYGREDRMFQNSTLMLHSKILKIKLPGNRSQTVFKTPLPQRFIDFIKKNDK